MLFLARRSPRKFRLVLRPRSSSPRRRGGPRQRMLPLLQQQTARRERRRRRERRARRRRRERRARRRRARRARRARGRKARGRSRRRELVLARLPCRMTTARRLCSPSKAMRATNPTIPSVGVPTTTSPIHLRTHAGREISIPGKSHLDIHSLASVLTSSPPPPFLPRPAPPLQSSLGRFLTSLAASLSATTRSRCTRRWAGPPTAPSCSPTPTPISVEPPTPLPRPMTCNLRLAMSRDRETTRRQELGALGALGAER